MIKSSVVLIAAPFNATITTPLERAFRKLGFATYLFDYRNVTGNFRFQPVFYTLMTIITCVKLLFSNKLTRLTLLNEMLYLSCYFFRPTYLFVVKGEYVTSTTIQKIKRLRITTMVWQVDPSLHPLIWPFVNKYQRAYDIYITCEPGRVMTELKKRGFKKVLYMLGAADEEEMHFDQKIPKQYDVCLIGTYHPIRAKFLQALEGLDVHVWGWGDWKNSSVASMYEGKALSHPQMLDTYKKSKIVINVGRAIDSTIPTNLRPFEAAQVGAFILVNHTPNLKDIFVLGKEIETFQTQEELRRKAYYFLTHPQQRIRIAKAMYKRTKKEHTYTTRLRNLFEEVHLLGY